MAPQTVTFQSRFTELVLWRVPIVEIINAGTGLRTVTQKGIHYDFHKAPDGAGGEIGELTLQVGQDRLEDGLDWLARNQESGVERDAVDAVRAHVWFGAQVWEKGWQPGTLEPRPADFRRDLMTAVSVLDADKVNEMLEEELTTHARGDLVAEAETALASINAAQDALEAHLEGPAPAAWSERDTIAELQKVADERGLTVTGTGQGGKVKHSDLVDALKASDEAAATA